ncbi:MAG: hypothetical protein CML68_08375 [Rhodobacteraceae bacterium]|nr:hypothetical protein [Paracoccaceae bacterium]
MATTPALAQEVNTGRFTTAEEVRPILEATRGSWVAVREYDGQDWLYVTQIMSWRCGLQSMRVAINGGQMQVWPLIPCHLGNQNPNSINSDDTLPAVSLPLGAIETVQVELTLDDGSVIGDSFDRAAVKMN